ncbi:MAG TPA: type II toxin-antitoxin system Phd/YefM family antitoxin [Candidatus Desulfaltia sp.]|nr:type II toxin-antitoxin system Phd/YefM family antitoxin [Candidatus Desulfaltia sp.]
MTSYTFSEARQNFAAVLEKAKVEGGVLITRRDGTIFEILPVPRKELPLDVRGIDLGLSVDEIVNIIRETRER